jgi:hypothetical protein
MSHSIKKLGIFKIVVHEKNVLGWCQWLNPVILATQEAEIRRIKV